MKILYIKNNSTISSDIEMAFLHLKCSLIYHMAPSDDEKDNSFYLSSFLNMIKQETPSIVFSPEFIPFISLACGVLGVPYVVWLTKGYHPDYYSPTIRNEWNCVFVADSELYQDLRNLGVENLFFLPLGAPVVDKEAEINLLEKEKYKADVSMVGTILAREDFKYNPLTISSPLKDATKGYLEGCVACQHQFHGMQSICSNLPHYIWDDLVSAYPVPLDSTLLTAQKYYEYNFFNHLITYADRDLHLNAYVEERYQKVHLYSKNDKYSSEKIKNMGWVDYHKTLPAIAEQSIINLMISHRNDRAMIPATAWMIMASKGFLLSNVQKDYDILEVSPITYKDAKEMLSLSAYYYHHEDERKEIAEKIYLEAMKKHTYAHRIKEILSVIC